MSADFVKLLQVCVTELNTYSSAHQKLARLMIKRLTEELDPQPKPSVARRSRPARSAPRVVSG
jgi:hypothetical protein